MSTYFDDAARTWDSPEKVQRSRTLADAIAADVPLDPAWRCLEVGCGTGQLTWQLGDRIGTATLVDTSTGMLEVAAEHAASAPGRYTVLQHDLSVEPLEVEVDLAYSAMALHHIHDLSALLTHMTDVIAAGGWIALADMDADPENHFHADDFHGHRGIDRDHLARQLRELGYEDVAVRTATTLTKEKNGQAREFDVFVAVGRRPATAPDSVTA